MLKMQPGAIKRAEKMFARHAGRYVRGPRFDVLDWKIPNTIQYWVRMVFDHERDDTRAVYITGDLGEAVVYPICAATLEGMAKCFTFRGDNGEIYVREHYFLEKIKTANSLYDWDVKYLQSDLRDEFVQRYGKDADQDELDEFFEEFCDGYYIDDVYVDEGGVHIGGSGARDALSDIFHDYEEWVWKCGRRIDDRVIYWLVAMRLAYEKLEKGEHDKEK